MRENGLEREVARTHHLAERYLHLAIESALDIANHLIADSNLESPETYRDAFAILTRHGVIDAKATTFSAQKKVFVGS